MMTLLMMTSNERCQVLEKVCPLRRKLRRRRQAGQICLLVACGKDDPWLSFCPTQIWLLFCLVVRHSLTGVIHTWMMWPWLLKKPTLKIRQRWKNIRNSTIQNVDVVTVADVNAEERVVEADFWSRLVIKQFFGEIIQPLGPLCLF